MKVATFLILKSTKKFNNKFEANRQALKEKTKLVKLLSDLQESKICNCSQNQFLAIPRFSFSLGSVALNGRHDFINTRGRCQKVKKKSRERRRSLSTKNNQTGGESRSRFVPVADAI